MTPTKSKRQPSSCNRAGDIAHTNLAKRKAFSASLFLLHTGLSQSWRDFSRVCVMPRRTVSRPAGKMNARKGQPPAPARGLFPRSVTPENRVGKIIPSPRTAALFSFHGKLNQEAQGLGFTRGSNPVRGRVSISTGALFPCWQRFGRDCCPESRLHVPLEIRSRYAASYALLLPSMHVE